MLSEVMVTSNKPISVGLFPVGPPQTRVDVLFHVMNYQSISILIFNLKRQELNCRYRN